MRLRNRAPNAFAAVVAIVVGLLVFGMPSGAVAAPELDQSFEPGGGAAFVANVEAGFMSFINAAQTFTVGKAGTLVGVDVLVSRFSFTNRDLRVEIRPTINGVPVEDDSAVLVSATVPATSVPTFRGFVSVDLSKLCAASVNPGDVLAIVLSTTENNGFYQWHGDSGDQYPAGSGFFRTTPSWFQFSADLGFRTFVDASCVPAPQVIQSQFFLHGSGNPANPPILFLDAVPPGATAAKYKDSGAVSFNGGNPWKVIGTWSADPSETEGELAELSSLGVWLGLKNSDDIGTQFDLRAEVYKNETLVALGTSLCITNITREPTRAKEIITPLDLSSPIDFDGVADVLSLRILTRIGTNPDGRKCSGPGGSHSSAVGLRLYFDAVGRSSKFEAVAP